MKRASKRAAGVSNEGRIIPSGRHDRKNFDDVDLTEVDDLEEWVGEQLRDWQLLIGATEFGRLLTIIDADIDRYTKKQENLVGLSQREIGNIEGNLQTLRTFKNQIQHAIDARVDRIGEGLLEGKQQ